MVVNKLQALAAKVAALENTEDAMVTSSGMTAISTTILTLLRAGDHMLVQTSLYGATEVLFTDDFPEWGITCTRVDADKPETWAAAMKPNTKVHRAKFCFLVLLVMTVLMHLLHLNVQLCMQCMLCMICCMSFCTFYYF